MASLVVYHKAGALFLDYQKKGFKISVYVDDLTISSPTCFKSFTSQVLEDLRDRGFKIKFSKTHYCTKSPVVTGVPVKNNGIHPPSKTFEASRDMSRSESSRQGHLERIKYIKRISKIKGNKE